ncbi:MAG: S9 family peptidase [Terriglobales bacterium]
MPTAPAAARHPHVEIRHEQSFNDDYYWLRERDNPAVIEYLKAENAYTEAVTAAAVQPLAETLYAEMLGRMQQTDLSVPVRRGAYLYYSRTVEGQQYPIYCRRQGSMEAEEETLLDLNVLAEGHAFLGLGAFAVSDDAGKLAYTVDTTGMRRYQLQVKDLTTGELLATQAERVTSLEWASDDQTLLYTTEDATTKRSDRLLRQRLEGAAEEVYYEADELYNIGVQRTRDRAYLLLEAAATDSTEFRFWRSDTPAAAPQLFLARERDHKYDLDHRGGLFYIRSNRGAKNFRLLTTPVEHWEPEHWREMVAHDPEVLLEGVELFQDFAVMAERHLGLERLRVWRFAGDGSWAAIPVAEPVYSLEPSANPEFGTRQFRYQYESPITPASIFEYDMAEGSVTLLKQQPVLGGYDAARYRCERQWARARDGVQVPISIVYPAGMARDGQAPLLLYGYGAYGYGMSAGFSVARLSLLDRGMVYAIAHVRGGNELGEAWHDGGMLLQKKNTFYDFIDCAGFLIGAGWTKAERLAIEGGSAGGLLTGAVLNLRPELFAAAHLAVPFVDVINTMCDETLPLTTGEYLEWGDPRQPEPFATMLSYSPYDNLAARRYPAVLVTTSLNDSQVMYWEPAKYVARMRALNPEGTVLLKTNLGAGHGGASGRYDRLRETAFAYAWLLIQAGSSEGGAATTAASKPANCKS